ncbi:hypothetical protein [Streptomyces sp. NPDC055632]
MLTRNRWRKLAFVCAVSALAVGCNTNEPTSEKPPSTPSVSATTPTATPPKTQLPPDPVETAKKEAVDTYLSLWQEAEKRYADKTGKAGDLKKYATAVALAQLEADTKQMREKDLVILGEVTVGNPTVTSADIDRKVPKAVISSCLDVSRWTVTSISTGKPAELPKNRLLRYVIKATVEKWPQGWRVILDEPQGKKC